MSETTFEIYTFKGGKWNIDSIHDDKAMALSQARALMDSSHHNAVKVVSEIYNPDTDTVSGATIFNKKKGDISGKAKSARDIKQKRQDKTDAAKKKKDHLIKRQAEIKKSKGTFIGQLIKMMLVLGVIGGLVLAVGVYLTGMLEK